MKKWFAILAALIWTVPISGQSGNSRSFLPPYHFRIDSVSLLANWESPKIVLMEEDFEGGIFPPSGWSAASLGVGWLGVDSPAFQYWTVPAHAGKFALTNDDAANYSNNGSLDYLVTPVLNLTVADSFHLFFDSYFDGGYGQRAFLEYSPDSGITWLQLKQLDASLEWKTLEVDLSGFSGPEGDSVFQLAFHADDYGYDASGWAIDNVLVYSDRNPQEVIGYKVLLDSEVVGQVDITSYQYSFEFTTTHNCGLMALYQGGVSDTVRQSIHSLYFPKPENLTGVVPDETAILSWDPPVKIDYLIGYNIYKNGDFLAYVNCTEPGCCHYLDPVDCSEESYFSYDVTALYELSGYGFPGEIGESLPDGPAALTTCCLNELDFFEDWPLYSNGNYWKFSGNNWKVDPELGNDAPSAVFQPDSVLLQYEDTLQSYLFLTGTEMTVDIVLEYDVALSSVNSSGNEKLLVQVYDYLNKTWNTVMTHNNLEGGFDWMRDTIDITQVFNGRGFRIRFKTMGENSADINYWAIDNITVRREFYPPKNIQASILPSEDSILVSWEDPLPEIGDWWEWDDGIQAERLGFGVGKQDWFACAVRWTPEQLITIKDAKLTAISFIPGDDNSFYKITVWTGENKDLIYTQAAGNLYINEWNVIKLDHPLKVDVTNDLMVGYQFSETGGFPMSVGVGPCVDGYSNLVQFGSGQPWETLLESSGFDWNWNIKAYFERDGYPAGSYKLYRSLDGGDPQMIAETENLEYIDTVSQGYTTSCYKLKSVFYDEYESGFSEEVCVLITNSDPVELKNGGFLRIFPNPSDRTVITESSESIESISLYDIFGKLMLMKKVDERQVEIPVSDYPSGVYMIRVEMVGEVVSRKIMVVH